MSEGYSGTPLIKKLGIKVDNKIGLVNPPEHYLELLGDLPEGATIVSDMGDADFDFIHAFYVHRADYEADLDILKTAIHNNGMIWISWYKKAAKMPTDITEDVIRDLALDNGLVDVKVAAIDKQWSGLKLVYRKSDR